MNRISKILAIVLLVALCLSTLGIFSVFAEEAASSAVEYGTFIKSPDSKFGSVSAASNGQPSMATRTDDNGKTYYTLGFDGVDPAAGDYVQVSFNVDNKTAENGIRIGNYTFADGSTVEKNTDYMVVDFDMSTDTTYIDGLYFHTAFYNATYTHAARYQPKPLYFDLDGEDNESFSIGLNGTASEAYAYAPYAEEVWQHVTFVYDFRDTSSVSVHFYINGIYSGSKTGVNISSALTFYFFRISTPTQSINNASTNFANFSIKRFEVGYDGPFTGDRALAHRGTTLDQLPDLAYCLEDAPVTQKTKLADVVGADGSSFTAYNVSELDANLKDGDVVTLYKGISRSLLVPTGASITFKDANGTVLTPGTYTAGDLVNLSATTAIDFTANTVVERARKTYAAGTTGTDLSDVMAGESNYVYTLLADATDSFENEGLADCYSVLDLNGHTATLSTTSGKRAFLSGSKYKIMDGNLIWNGGGADFTMTNAGAMMIFDDVNLTNNSNTFIDGRGGVVMFNDSTVTRNPYLYSSSKKQYATGSIVSEKSTSGTTMSLIVDGTSMDFTNLEVPEGYTLDVDYVFYMNNVSTGGSRYGGSRNYLVIRDGSDIKMKGAALVYGHAYTATAGTVETEQVYDEATGKYINKFVSLTPSAATIENKNENYIDIVDSTIESNYSIISTEASFATNRSTGKVTGTITVTETDAETGEEVEVSKEVTYAAQNFTVKAEKFDYDVGVDIKGSTIKTAGSLLYTSRGKLTSGAANLAENYHYDVNVSIDGASKISSNTSVINRNELEDIDMVIALADGARLVNDKVLYTNDNGNGANVTLGAGESVIARSSLTEGYDYIVTPNYKNHNWTVYQYDGKTPYADKSGSVTWNVAEGEVFDRSLLPELPKNDATIYEYPDWTEKEDETGKNVNYTSGLKLKFAMSANLTALTDFYINIYLSKADDTVNLSELNMNINSTDIESFVEVDVNGKTYYKAEDGVIRGVTPELAAQNYPVTISFVDGYGEEVNLSTNVSLEKYLVRAKGNTGTDEGDALIQAITNYILAADAYNGDGIVGELQGTEITTPTYENAKWNEGDNPVTGVSAAINLGDSVRWVFSTESTETYTITYASGTRKFTAKDGQITITVKAVDLLEDITISCGENSSTINLAGYYTQLADDAKAQTIVNALYHYSVAAQAYANVSTPAAE